MREKGIMALIISVATWLFGGWDWLLQALVAMIVLDTVAGVVHATVSKRLNSSKLRHGLVKKVGCLLLVAVATVLDRSVFQHAPFARTLVTSYLIAHEALSIVEHMVAIGVPFPQSVKDALQRVRESADTHQQGGDNGRASSSGTD